MSVGQERQGSLNPPGAFWDEKRQAWNFVLYSRAASRVRLLLYGAADPRVPILEYELLPLVNKSGPIWHCQIHQHEAPGARYYAYRVWGPQRSDGSWHTFDEQKILLDPYAEAVHFPPAYSREAASRPGANDGQAPLGVLNVRNAFDWRGDQHVQRSRDLVIYEVHVRGFTQHPNSGVAAQRRGTFLGVIDKIPHLQELGVTAVELMPVFQFDPQENNYWGYMTLNFFAPHSRYCVHGDPTAQQHEFREMVRQLHHAGIEVILDVVYNHTCEGDQRGPIYSYKGIDNGLYYVETGDRDRPYANYSGCGNTLKASSIAVQKMIVDSLRFWYDEMHVDGFRFDLASIFARRADGSIDCEHPPVFGQITTALGSGTPRLIAEPWDAAGAYQLGRDFPGWLWMQWNGAYRDCLQRFVRGEQGMIPELMSRLYGSADLFSDDLFHSCRPWQSINYIVSHDGSTLYDLVSFDRKNNWANGHNNTDGCVEHRWNCGWEGDKNVPANVTRLRKQQIRNFFCLLFLSNGTPMFRMGDEFLQTQGGNNNAYNQDNETSWLDWNRLDQHRDIFRFVQRMIAFRRAHPSICRTSFWREDIRWYGVHYGVDFAHHSHTVAFCLHGESLGDVNLYVMINGYHEDLTFRIQEGLVGQWRRVIDTSEESPLDIRDPGREATVESDRCRVRARSVVVLISQPEIRQPAGRTAS